LGGKITVESEWGRGSVFTLEVPQIIQQDESMGRDYFASAGRAQGEAFFTAKGGRVLAVDDSRENLLVLSSLLRRTRLTVDTVSSGSECLEAVKKKSYHLIFMDYMMSGMDGIETFRRLREENKNFAVPVIALSADARREMEERFLAEGFSACLTKPVIWRELEQCLREWLPPELLTRGMRGEVSDSPSDPPAENPTEDRRRYPPILLADGGIFYGRL
jgi:CheY-like chemotaxis protein